MIDLKTYGIVPSGPIPNEKQLAHFHIKKAFFHFGVNTFTDLEWGNGTEPEKAFNPTELDIEQWMRTIRDAGFELAIITAKHHDGFCLWPSKFTEHSVKNSPYKNGNGDIIREFTDACRKYGIKAGVYISPWDRNSPLWGKEEYSFYYADQLRELLTEYGEIHEVWWDGAGSTETVYHWDLWASIVRECQPKACIFGSMGATPFVDLRWVGNERGYAGETHYATIDAKFLAVETPSELNKGNIYGDRYIPSETDVSIRPGWFYHADQDARVKSVSHINKIWFESVGRNSIMLLNFPPDRRGLIHEIDARNAKLSHDCISKMLSEDEIINAKITADSTWCEELSAENLALADEERFWAAAQGEKRAVIDIALRGEKEINVLTISEVVEAGERITAFSIESVDGEETTLLYEGTSVGFYRALQIPSAKYKHLRLTVLSDVDTPILRKLGLHYFEDVHKETAEGTRVNLASDITYSEDGTAAVIAFGGIYPFNSISFHPKKATNYRIYAFNGLSYEKICEGHADAVWDKIELANTVNGSYQIKIETEYGFADENIFEVF